MRDLKRRLLFDYYLGGLLHHLLKPLVVLLGYFLRRDHKLAHCQDVTYVKLLGGGSLVLAYPSLLALKRSGRVKTLRLVASNATKSFGEVLGIFDEIIVIREEHPGTLLLDSARVLRRLFRCDCIVDLEVHSRLTTVFCLFTCARNRIGFATLNSFWRQRLATHLLYLNLGAGIYWYYDQIAKLLGEEVPSFREASQVFTAQLTGGTPPLRQAQGEPPPASSASPESAGAGTPGDGQTHIGVGACCSELGRERGMQIGEWVSVLRGKVAATKGPVVLHLLGGKGDRKYLEGLKSALEADLTGAQVHNHAGELTLRASVVLMRQMREFVSIDSGLLHFARLMGVNTTSYWGPTDPATRLRATDLAADVVHYHPIPCSPCVHITSVVPCRGNNRCMRFAVDPDCPEDPNPFWLADWGQELEALEAPRAAR